MQTAYSIYGENNFDSMFEYFQYIKNHKDKFLKIYHVDYIVFDKEKDLWKIPNNMKIVWQSGRFVVYSVF